MNLDLYLKANDNRERHAVITMQMAEAEALRRMVMDQPKGSLLEVRPAEPSPFMLPVSREVLGSALRQYLTGKEEVLEKIQQEFNDL